MTKRYLFLFAQLLDDFRLAELAALLDLAGVSYAACEKQLSSKWPTLVIELEDEAAVKLVLSRSLLVKHAYEILAEADSLQQLHAQYEHEWHKRPDFFNTTDKYCFRVKSVDKKTKQSHANQCIDSFSYLPMASGQVSLSNAKHHLHVVELYEKSTQHQQTDAQLGYVYFGYWLGAGQTHLPDVYNIKQRCYIGNTTLDPRLALIQANLAHVQQGSLVLDPFVGTGGILLAAAHFGGACTGAEINYGVAHAVGKSSRVTQKYLSDRESIAANFVQYGLADRLLAIVLADASRPDVWRTANCWDAILCDPPYGLREKCSKLGKRELKEGWIEKEKPEPGSCDHYPQKTRYALSDVFTDLLDFAAVHLVLGGRLAYWLPCVRDQYTPDAVPRHDCLQLVFNCEQHLYGQSSRRLVVMAKHRQPGSNDRAYVLNDLHQKMSFRNTVLKFNDS